MNARSWLIALSLPFFATGCIIDTCTDDSDSDTDTDVDTDIPDCSEVWDVETVTEDTTITADCVTEVPNFVVVKNDATLTIEAGSRLAFAADAGIEIERARIVIRHAIFEYGGAPHNAYEDQGVLSLAWVTGYEPGTFVLEDSVFRNNLYGGVGVWSLTGGTPYAGLFSSFSGNTFSNNGGVSIRLPVHSMADIAEDNVLDEPVRVATHNFYDDHPWPDLGQPYILESGLRVADAEAELHLDGLELQFERRTGLELSAGALFATDTTFTSAAKTPQPGDWEQIFVGFVSRASIEDCRVEFQGKAGDGSVRFQNDSALYSTITGTTFANNVGAANVRAQEYCSRFTSAEADNTFDLTPCMVGP